MCNTAESPAEDSVVTRVKGRMAELGVSQVALSDRSGIARATLIRRLQGQSAFRIDELEAVAGVLDCSVTDLLPAEAA